MYCGLRKITLLVCAILMARLDGKAIHVGFGGDIAGGINLEFKDHEESKILTFRVKPNYWQNLYEDGVGDSKEVSGSGHYSIAGQFMSKINDDLFFLSGVSFEASASVKPMHSTSNYRSNTPTHPNISDVRSVMKESEGLRFVDASYWGVYLKTGMLYHISKDVDFKLDILLFGIEEVTAKWASEVYDGAGEPVIKNNKARVGNWMPRIYLGFTYYIQ